MRKAVLQKTYAALPPYDQHEILRYAGAREATDGQLQELLGECIAACESVFTPRVCYTELTKAEFFEIFPQSESARLWTKDCDRVIVFAASVGLEIDRLVNRYASVSTAKALLLQAIGAERIEALCDVFCAEQSARSAGRAVGRRFSPGYGDFPLTAQKEMFALLDPPKRIGVTLTDALLMSPTKSVTAAFGLKNSVCHSKTETRCDGCAQKDCAYKKEN